MIEDLSQFNTTVTQPIPLKQIGDTITILEFQQMLTVLQQVLTHTHIFNDD
jgi:hypothetical protein